jgi:hypothetical protein
MKAVEANISAVRIEKRNDLGAWQPKSSDGLALSQLVRTVPRRRNGRARGLQEGASGAPRYDQKL